MTSLDVSNAVNAVVNAYSGQRIGFPGVDVGQCPAPVCEYMLRLGAPIPSMANDRADGWGTNFPPALAPYFIHEGFEIGKAYPRGTILMWNSPHIAILLHIDGTIVTVFEQNADPDESPCATHTRNLAQPPWHQPTYALIPIIAASTPPAPLPTVHPYTIQTIDPKPVVIRKGAIKKGMNFDNATAMNASQNIQAVLQVDTRTTINAICHHSLGDFYLEDPTVPAGWDEDDCTDYVVPVPYVPPAAPVPVKLAQKVTLLTDVPTYKTYLDALNNNNKIGTLVAGTYYLWTTTSEMQNLSSSNMTAGLWVNPKDNVAPPLPTPPPKAVEPQVATPSVTEIATSYLPSEVPIGTEADTTWKATYRNTHTNGVSDIFELILDYNASDYGGVKKPVNLPAGTRLNVPGTFTKNGVKFYRPRDYKKDANFSWWYGIPLFNDDKNPIVRQVVEESLPLKAADLFRLWKSDIRNYVKEVLLGGKPKTK